MHLELIFNFLWEVLKLRTGFKNVVISKTRLIIIHGQSKKFIWGASSQGSTQKICWPPSAAGKFFRQPCHPRVENDLKFFTHGIPRGCSRGSFISTFLLGLTPLGSFSWFFLIFSEFSWFFSVFLDFARFFPKKFASRLWRPKIFPPLCSWPLPNFFYPWSKKFPGMLRHPLSLPMGVDQKNFFTQGSSPPLPTPLPTYDVHELFHVSSNHIFA